MAPRHLNQQPQSQQLQPPSHLIDHSLGPRTDAQHRRAAARNLRAPRIVHDLRAEPQAHRLRLQQLHLVLTLHLQRDLGLALALPAAEEGLGGGQGVEERFVAGEGRVRALCCYFALFWVV